MLLNITGLSNDGRGISKAEDGRLVFIPYALPGDTVQAQILSQKSNYAVARILEITQPSSLRVPSVCPHMSGFDCCEKKECGGCPLMCLSYKAQLEFKQNLLTDAMHRLSEDIIVSSPVSGPQLYYRSRLRFRYGLSEGKPVLSLFEQKTHSNVSLSACPVADKEMNAFISNPPKLNLWELEDGQLSCISTDNGVLYDEGIGQITLPVFDKKRSLYVSNKVFFQSNLFLLPALIEEVVSAVQGPVVLDLYSGVGTFSAFLEDSHKVIAVENNKNCLSLARKHLKNTEFFTQNVESFSFSKLKAFNPNTVIVDPPRVGLDKNVPSLLTALNAKQLIYVSCYLPTLIRDLERLTALGWHIEKAQFFDFYPNTPHLECVVMIKHCQGSR